MKSINRKMKRIQNIYGHVDKRIEQIESGFDVLDEKVSLIDYQVHNKNEKSIQIGDFQQDENAESKNMTSVFLTQGSCLKKQEGQI